MRNPKEALEEIRVNVEKLRAQPSISPTENALFGMVDGLATLVHATMVRVTELERRLAEATGVATAVRKEVVARPATPKG